MDFKIVLSRVLDGSDLDHSVMSSSMDSILSGEWAHAQIAAFLVAMQSKGESPAELASAAGALAEKCVPVSLDNPEKVLDTAGTGGDSKGTFNVSTAAAFIAAACGVRVAKHGNRAMSGTCGSSDLLTALGANLKSSPTEITDCHDKTGICFMFAPAHHPALKEVAPVRSQLGVRTMFNLLGPLVNPAGAGCRLAGVFDDGWVMPYARTFEKIGVRRAVVVHSDGLDEFSVSGTSRYAVLADGKVSEHEAHPSDFGLATHDLSELVVKDVDSAVVAFNDAIDGRSIPLKEFAALNAGGALLAACAVPDLAQGVQKALQAIESGAARAKVVDFLAHSK